MEPVERIDPSLPIDEDIDLQVKAWIIQRVGWSVLTAFVVMACLGLFGTGWLSHRKIGDRGNVVGYERFGRLSTPMTLTLYTVAAADGTIRIRIPQHYFDAYELKTIIPAPSQQTIADGSYHFRYDQTDKSGVNTIRLHLLPTQMGSIRTTIVVNSKSFQLTHFIYP